MFDKELFLVKTHKHKKDYLKEFPDSRGFSIDGPNDCDLWNNQETKVLFLLKETYNVKGDVCQCMDSLKYNKNGFYSNKTNRNIAKLSYGLISGNKTAGVSKSILSHYYSSVATIEIKKSTGLKKSHGPTILKHAKFSKEFIKWQVEQLRPNIIICCGKIVYEFALNELFDTEKKGCITKIGETIIVKSAHPSAPGYKVDVIVEQCNEYIKREATNKVLKMD